MARLTNCLIVLVCLLFATAAASGAEVVTTNASTATEDGKSDSGLQDGTSNDRGFCQITIDCENGTTLSCSDTQGSPSCVGADQNCNAGQRGYVNCNGGAVEANCNACPPTCTQGEACFGPGDCGFGFCDREPFEFFGNCICSPD